MRLPSQRALELYAVITEAIQQSDDGIVRNLFELGVRRAGQPYNMAHLRLRQLERKGLVNVERFNKGVPVVISQNGPLQLRFENM